MSQPQPGTLKYKIEKIISISIDKDSVTILITDGTTTRRAEEKAPKRANLDNLPHRVLLRLWNKGANVPNKQWRTVTQRAQESIINDAVDAILRMLDSNATPTYADIIPPARKVLSEADKLDDWQKLNTMLQKMTETELRQFLSFIILITLTKSAGD